MSVLSSCAYRIPATAITAMNNESLVIEKSGGWADRLFSSYDTDFGKIYIITEHDRSVTTILLPDEYV